MDRQRLFEIWAPPESVWTPWAKPVLFARMPERLLGSPGGLPLVPDVDWKRSADTGVIVDAPGGMGVSIGIALARLGHRPVPLYNTTPDTMPLVPVEGIIAGLVGYADELASLRIAPDAPPAFLLDSDRLSGVRQPGHYDNRWMVFEQDFPSATFLKSRGIRSMVLLRQTGGGPGADLLRVLSSWRKGGIEILRTGGQGLEPVPVRSTFPWRIGAAFAMLGAGLRANSAGGFGSRVPIPSQSSGYG